MRIIVKIFFSKKGILRFISHLDLMRTFMRALRRSCLKVGFSQGFSPHPRFSIKQALKLGIEFQNQEAEFELSEDAGQDVIVQNLSRQLPCEIQITKINIIS